VIITTARRDTTNTLTWLPAGWSVITTDRVDIPHGVVVSPVSGRPDLGSGSGATGRDRRRAGVVSRHLQTHPGVAESAAAGVPTTNGPRRTSGMEGAAHVAQHLIPGAIVRCSRASSRSPHAWAPTERQTDMNLRRTAAVVAIAAALTTIVAPPADAHESRASNGMGHGDGPCMAVATPTERALMRHESNGWPTARNPRSSAYGCPQALLVIRRRYAPRCGATNPWTTDVGVQMCILRGYVRDRHGSTARALSFRRTHGWY